MRSDEELIQAIVARDEGAFDELFARHEAALRSRIMRIVRRPGAADDLVQELFLRVWRRAGQYAGRGSAAAWLARIATNLALNHLRSVRRRRDRPLDAAQCDAGRRSADHDWMIDAGQPAPDDALEAAEQNELLRRIIDGLGEDRRRLYRMVTEEDMDLRAVAEELGIPLGTVKSRLHYARLRLARAWQELQQESDER